MTAAVTSAHQPITRLVSSVLNTHSVWVNLHRSGLYANSSGVSVTTCCWRDKRRREHSWYWDINTARKVSKNKSFKTYSLNQHDQFTNIFDNSNPQIVARLSNFDEFVQSFGLCLFHFQHLITTGKSVIVNIHVLSSVAFQNVTKVQEGTQK